MDWERKASNTYSMLRLILYSQYIMRMWLDVEIFSWMSIGVIFSLIFVREEQSRTCCRDVGYWRQRKLLLLSRMCLKDCYIWRKIILFIDIWRLLISFLIINVELLLRILDLLRRSSIFVFSCRQPFRDLNIGSLPFMLLKLLLIASMFKILMCGGLVVLFISSFMGKVHMPGLGPRRTQTKCSETFGADTS